MEYKDERSEDLRLRLFQGALELTAFPVVARAVTRMAGLEVDACIIGASHAVQIRAGERTLTEVLACRTEAAELFADRLAGSWGLGGSVSLEPWPGLGYWFESELLPLADSGALIEDFRRSVRAAALVGEIGLSFLFPSLGPPQPGSLSPETLLYVSALEGELGIRSVHVYPGEGLAVLSRSRLALDRQNSRLRDGWLVEVGS
ncbi:MAG: DUF2617 family protein [Acidobacteria bacterium]|nr:DUF2617 family protein [Acidobacteriota bacterium]